MCNSIHQCLRHQYTTPIRVPNTAVALKSTTTDIVSSGAYRLFASQLCPPLTLYTAARGPWREFVGAKAGPCGSVIYASVVFSRRGPGSMEYWLMCPASAPRNADGLLTTMNWEGITVQPQRACIRESLFVMAWRKKRVMVPCPVRPRRPVYAKND